MVVIHGKVDVDAIKQVAEQILRELQEQGGGMGNV